ncbi:MAG TPA: hypothetical protein VFG71_08955 [Nitrospiraceae bacterium]|nr:hypothetical protein [Nitrospiraceae bacterium]
MTAAAYEYDVPTEEVLLGILRDGEIRTMDGLVEASGLDWSRVFLAIDRLSRTGDISLRRAGRPQYQVCITGKKG